MITDFDAIKKSYADFAAAHGLTIQVIKHGYDSTDQQFKFRVTLQRNGKADGQTDIPYFVGQAVPMNNPEVITQGRRYCRTSPDLRGVNIDNPKYISCGRQSFNQRAINDCFIKAASALYQPSVVDILNCLRSDLQCVYYPGDGFTVTFSDFCEELGYNDDSIKDKSVYETVMEQSQRFVRLLGGVAVAELLELESL